MSNVIFIYLPTRLTEYFFIVAYNNFSTHQKAKSPSIKLRLFDYLKTLKAYQISRTHGARQLFQLGQALLKQYPQERQSALQCE